MRAEDLLVAIAWLESNEGDDGEAAACARVAERLRAEWQTRQARAVARRHNVPMRLARAAVEKVIAGT